MNVESCKYRHPKQIVLIDTWWNVNLNSYRRFCVLHVVLIDTWWNVNYHIDFDDFEKQIVLIDTWWNVNSKVAKYIGWGAMSFNRYMVECEYDNI